MIRTTLLWMFITWLGLTAWKDWYRSLCGLILLMGVFQHPDMPKSILDIPGLNPWNLLLVVTFIAWFSHRNLDGYKWDMPSKYSTLLVLYLCIVVIGFFRMLWDLNGLNYYSNVTGWPMPSNTDFFNEYFINTIKWTVPAILLFDGCRTDARLKMALAAILGASLLIALQVIKCVPIQVLMAQGADLSEKTISLLRKDVGYHRTDLAVMLSGSFWAFFSAREIFKLRLWGTLLYLAGSTALLLSLALTGGRGGYLAWAMISLVFCVFRYRKLLIILPIILVIALPLAPSLVTRMTEGLTSEEGIDQNTLTAGRNIAWPLVIEKITASPIFGYGREAMKRTGIATRIVLEFKDSAPHPHNAYLEMLLDNGAIGFTIAISFFFLIIKNSLELFLDRDSVNFRVVGGVSLSLVGAHLIGSLTGQTFYPREAAFGMWCAIGLLLRVIVIRSDPGRKKMLHNFSYRNI